ncbi:hypothetical protein [uncultured Gammaproteobacteria bacterium]|nr:hypothetical protein [uncultured Gammaproteobacteria bacterium]
MLGLKSKYKSNKAYSKKSPVFTGIFSLFALLRPLHKYE